MTTTMTTLDAKEKLTDLINHVVHTKERVVLTRREKQVAAIVSLEDFELLESLQDKKDLHDAMDALKEAKQSGTTTLGQLKDEIGG